MANGHGGSRAGLVNKKNALADNILESNLGRRKIKYWFLVK